MEETLSAHPNWVKNGKKKVQMVGQTTLESFQRQKIKTGENGLDIPINRFFDNIMPGIGMVSKNLEKEAVKNAVNQSYRKTETSINKKLGRETIRRKVITKGKEAEKLEKTKIHQETINDLKDADNSTDSYKKSGGKEMKRNILAKILGLKILYFMADGVGVEIQNEKNDGMKRECKVGVFLKQTEDIVSEVGTFCTWQRINVFKDIVEWQLLGIFSKFYPIIIISDGAKWIRNLRTKIACMKKAIWILDWFHLKDHLLQLLRIFELDENSSYASHYLSLLWLGKTDLDLLKTLPFSEDEEVKFVQFAAVKKFETYLGNQKEGIVNYHAFKMKGYLVGSGFIEKRNDVLIKNRMVRQKRMRWSLEGGEAMMQLLATQMNGRLDELFM